MPSANCRPGTKAAGMWAIWTPRGSAPASRKRFKISTGDLAGSRNAAATRASASASNWAKTRDAAARLCRRISSVKLVNSRGLGQNPGRGCKSLAPQFFGKTGQFAGALVKLAPGDESAASLLAPDIAQLGQFLERLAHGYLADTKALCNLLFAGEAFIGPPPAGLNLSLEDILELMVQG